MAAWTTFWGWLLVCVLLIFTVLAVTITIGGFFDIKALLTTLKRQDTPDESADDE